MPEDGLTWMIPAGINVLQSVAVHAKAVRHVGQSDSEELLADVQTYHRQSQCQTPSLHLH